MLSMGQDVDELELQPDGSPDRGEDQDGQALSQIDRLDRTDCERDPNNDSGVDLDEMRGPNERGSDVLR